MIMIIINCCVLIIILLRPRENMVGVDMVLAQYPQITPYHRTYIIHDRI